MIRFENRFHADQKAVVACYLKVKLVTVNSLYDLVCGYAGYCSGLDQAKPLDIYGNAVKSTSVSSSVTLKTRGVKWKRFEVTLMTTV